MNQSRRQRTRQRVRRRVSPLWKWLGLAGVMGGALVAGGALVSRGERVRRAYTPEQVRERLHERARRAGAEPSGDDGRT